MPTKCLHCQWFLESVPKYFHRPRIIRRRKRPIQESKNLTRRYLSLSPSTIPTSDLESSGAKKKMSSTTKKTLNKNAKSRWKKSLFDLFCHNCQNVTFPIQFYPFLQLSPSRTTTAIQPLGRMGRVTAQVIVPTWVEQPRVHVQLDSGFAVHVRKSTPSFVTPLHIAKKPPNLCFSYQDMWVKYELKLHLLSKSRVSVYLQFSRIVPDNC